MCVNVELCGMLANTMHHVGVQCRSVCNQSHVLTGVCYSGLLT